MKLSSAFNAEPAVFTDEELLQFENEFLRDQIEMQELENSIELMETVKACIEKEGGVSASIEAMFGENFTNNENALSELNGQLEKAYESAFNKDFQLAKNAAVKQAMNAMFAKIGSITMDDLKKLKYPITLTISRRSNQLAADADNLEEMREVIAGIKDKADFESRREEISSKLMEIKAKTKKDEREAKAEPYQINSADEFMASIKEGELIRKEFKTRVASIQKSLWDMMSKVMKFAEAPSDKNLFIRFAMVTYRTILRCIMQNGREILRAVGK